MFVKISEAKVSLSKLIASLENGAREEIVITRNGKPVARLLLPDVKTEANQRLGFPGGKFPPMSLEGFNAMNEEIAELFYAGSIFPETDDDSS